MLGWIYRALVGHFGCCQHKWAVFEQYAVTRVGTTEQVGGRIILRCERCGDVRWRAW